MYVSRCQGAFVFASVSVYVSVSWVLGGMVMIIN